MAFDPFDEEKRTPKPAAHTIGQDLATLSVDELAERIELLEREIERVRQALTAKQASKNAADAVFRR